MATQIRPNRLEVSDRFPMLGFTVRTDGSAKRYEIAIATSPDLFGPDGKSHRSRSNFYSTRATGPLPIERGESVYVLPPEVLARFVGQQKLYYGLATAGNGAGKIEVVTMPASGSPYINISGLTGRSLQRVRLLPNRQRMASDYGKGGSEMEWAGDVMTPGTQPAAPSPAAGKNGADKNAAAAPVRYDDGYGPLPVTPAPAAATKPKPQPQAESLADDIPLDPGIGGQSIGVGALQIADIIVSTTDHLSSAVIRAGSGSQVSHAMLFVGQGGQVVEAVGSGVHLIPLADAIKDATVAVAFRIPDLTDDQRQMVADSIAKNLDKPYDKVGLVKQGVFQIHKKVCSALPDDARQSCENWSGRIDLGRGSDTSFFCSSLVVQAFDDAGVPITSRPPNWNSPQDIVDIAFKDGVLQYVGHLKAPIPSKSLLDIFGLSLAAGLAEQKKGASPYTRRPLREKAASLEGGQSFDENWNDVDVIGQPENYSCWATAGSMVVGWRDRMSIDIQTLKKLFTGKTGISSDRGLYATDDRKLADALGLVAAPPQCYTVDGFRGLLENYGPLWVGIHTDDGWGHAVVVTGIYGDGSMDNTYVRIHDPWGRAAGTPAHPGSHNPTPGQGSRYTLTFTEFGKEYESYASSTPDGTVNVQILHAADTGGRTIGVGTDQTYALAAADGTQSTKPGGGEASGHDWKKHHHHHHGDDKRKSHAASLAAQVLDADLQPAHLPKATRLSGATKLLVRGAIDAAVAVPMTPAFPALIQIVNAQGFSVGIGLGGDAGLLGGAGLGFGIILAPNNDVGVFGDFEIREGLLAGISADARVIVLRGGIDAFNETGSVAGITLEPEALGVGIPGEVTVIALFNSQGHFHGVSFRLGVGEALSPVQIFTATEKSVSAAVTQSVLAQAAAASGADHAIEGPILDGTDLSQSLALQSSLTPRWEPANKANYETVTGKRTINRLVIHITDSGPDVERVIKHFKDPATQASVHYIIAQDGEVVQMVSDNNIAWHAVGANDDSIGIDHVARQPHLLGPKDPGLPLTNTQLCVSAQLVNILCNQFNIPIDRQHIVGHEEVEPDTQHKGCPNAVWKWDHYMDSAGIDMDDPSKSCPNDPNIYAPLGIPGGAKGESLSLRLPLPPMPGKSRAMDVTSQQSTTISGGEGNITWELDQFPGIKTTARGAVAQLQSAETIQLRNWPYCDHGNGSRAAAWFKVDWKFSGQSLGQVRITPSGTQQGSKPLRVEARIEDGTSRDASTPALVVRFTYHFTTEGPDVVAVTELRLYSDGSIDQNSNWMSQVAA